MCLCATAARSRSIRQAAYPLAIGWVCTILWWLTMSRTGMTWGYSVIDVFLAAYLFQLSKTRRFPRPLFALHVSAILFQAAGALMSLEHFWVSLAINRYFEVSLLYVSGCAIYRIYLHRKNRRSERSAQSQNAFRRRLEAGA
jgi:hypothetical protein